LVGKHFRIPFYVTTSLRVFVRCFSHPIPDPWSRWYK